MCGGPSWGDNAMKVLTILAVLLGFGSMAQALEYACTTELACITTNGCEASAAPVRIVLSDDRAVQFNVGTAAHAMTRLAPATGTRVMAYGPGEAGQGLLALTIFDNLNFTYTSHLKLVMDPATGIKRAVNVTVLGKCNGGTGAWTY